MCYNFLNRFLYIISSSCQNNLTYWPQQLLSIWFYKIWKLNLRDIHLLYIFFYSLHEYLIKTYSVSDVVVTLVGTQVCLELKGFRRWFPALIWTSPGKARQLASEVPVTLSAHYGPSHETSCMPDGALGLLIISPPRELSFLDSTPSFILKVLLGVPATTWTPNIHTPQLLHYLPFWLLDTLFDLHSFPGLSLSCLYFLT